MQVAAQFGGGLNASGSPSLIRENEVAAASNIDFSLHEGAMVSRRGSRVLKTGLAGSIRAIYRNYNLPYDYGNSPWYVACTNTLYRIAGTATTALGTSSAGVSAVGFNSFDEFTLVAYGGTAGYLKDDGTNVTEWVMQAPGAALATFTVTTQASPLIVTTSWALDEGSNIIVSSATCTATGATGGRLVIIGDMLVSTAGPYTTTQTNLNSVDNKPIDDYGVDYVDIAFDVPEYVTKISRDYSIGDANFTNYFHTEHVPGNVDSAALTGDELVDSYISASNDAPTDIDTRERMLNELRLNLRIPTTVLPVASDTFGLWAVARGDFDVVGKTIGAGWNDIRAVRYIIEYSSGVVATIRNHQIRGSSEYSLNDADVGYVWWETLCTVS